MKENKFTGDLNCNSIQHTYLLPYFTYIFESFREIFYLILCRINTIENKNSNNTIKI